MAHGDNKVLILTWTLHHHSEERTPGRPARTDKRRGVRNPDGSCSVSCIASDCIGSQLLYDVDDSRERLARVSALQLQVVMRGEGGVGGGGGGGGGGSLPKGAIFSLKPDQSLRPR